LLFLLALGAASSLALPARAEGTSSRDDQEALLALAVGASTAIGPIAIGGARAGRTDLDHVERNQGWIAAGIGFTLAPVTAHLVTHEYGRAAFFAAVPAATTIGISTLSGLNPDGIYNGNPATRVGFVALFLGGATVSAIGVIDAAFAADRRKKAQGRASSVSFDVGPGSLGLRGAW
jgi:hypothetical protein